MFRKCIDISTKSFKSIVTGAALGGTIGLVSESTVYPVMRYMKSCNAVFDYAKSLSCPYIKAGGSYLAERCNQYFLCTNYENSTAYNLIMAYEPNVPMNYAKYSITGTIVGVGVGAVAGLTKEILEKILIQNSSSVRSLVQKFSEMPKWQKNAIKGSSLVITTALMTYCNYILSNAVESEDLNSFSKDHLFMASLMNLTEMVEGLMVFGLGYGSKIGLQACVSAIRQCGLFSRSQTEQRGFTELNEISVTPVSNNANPKR